MRGLLFWGMMLIVLPLTAQKKYPKKFKLPSNLVEVSGLYLQSADAFWWHNDSGSKPQLIQTNARGKTTKVIDLKAKNIDWEDITAAPDGTIYIGDFGNNLNARKNLKIYIYQPGTQKLDSIEFIYPDQKACPPKNKKGWNFNAEGFFWHRDSLHIFSKNQLHQGNDYSKHYTLPARPGQYTAQLRDSLYFKNRVITAAAISPDGQTVALLSYTYKRFLGFFPTSSASIFFLKDFKGNDFMKGKLFKKRAPSFILATQFESLDFLSNDEIYVASEQTAMIKPKAKRVKIKKRWFKSRKEIRANEYLRVQD